MESEEYTQKSVREESAQADEDNDNKELEGETPIVVTGGSLKIEYADKDPDGFEDDGSTAGTKKKLRHKKRDDVELTRVLITTKTSNTPLMEIKLRDLGKHHDCKIVIFYEMV